MPTNDPILRKDEVVSLGPRVEYNFLNLAWNGRLLPLYKDTVYCKYKDSMSSFFEYMMTQDFTCMTSFKHNEQNPRCYKVKTGALASGAAGAAVVVPLDASSMLLGGAYMLPQKGFAVQLPPIGKTAIVIDVDTTPNAMTMTIVPADATYAINLAAGSEVSVVPVNIKASGDCTKYDSTMRLPGIDVDSTLQTIGRDYSVAGEELASFCNSVFLYEELDENGNKVQTFWHRDLDLMQDEFEMGKHRWLINGESITNNNAALTGKKGTTGFLTALRARGGYWGYDATFDKADMKALTRKMIAERNYARAYTFWQGFGLRQNTDDVLDTISAGKLSWGCFGGNEEKWVNLGFNGFTIDGIEFYNQTEKHFSDPCYLGAAGFTYDTTGIMIPMDKVVGSGRTQPHTRVIVNYLADEKTGYSRQLEMRDWGVLKPGSYSGHCDEHNWKIGSTVGLQTHCMHHFYLIEKVS